jgi:NADPH:quinone reductase-like Zn-dependent oxidoreductase
VRAAVRTRFGPPEVVAVRDVPAPAPGDGELLVAVRVATVNRTDAHYRSGRPLLMRAIAGWTTPKAAILGCEFAGVVEAIGAGVTTFAAGDRVFGYCEGRFGAHAERLVVRADGHVAVVPDGVPLESAAPSTEGGHYALTHLRNAKVERGADVLVYGATGAIGSAAVQLAKALGATVTAVCATPHVELVARLGADRVVDYLTTDWTQDGQRYDAVIDAHGSRGFLDARRLLKDRGIVVSSGAGPYGQNLFWPFATLVGTDKRMVFTPPRIDQATVRWFAELLGSGAYRPLVDRTMALEAIVDAYRYVESGQKLGNLLLAVTEG